MGTFKFGNEEIVLNENVVSNISDEIGKRFNKLAAKEMMRFRDDYKSAHITVSNVAALSAKLGQACIDRSVNAAIDVLLENGIFDYDIARFMAQNQIFLFTEREVYCNQMHGLELLNREERQQQSERDTQRAGRSRWVGGGFGVKGAVKGAVTAGAMNAVTDIFRGMGDLSKDSEKYAQFLEKKKEYIQSEEFVNSLALDISNCIKEDIKGRLFSILSERIPDFSVSDSANDQQATALFNNLPRLNPQQQQKVLAQTIQLQPHNWKYIQYAYDHLDTLGVTKEDVDQLAQICDSEMFLGISSSSESVSTFGFDSIEQIPFNQEHYANEVKDIAKKQGTNVNYIEYIRDTLAIAVKYSLLDEKLNVLPQNAEELASAYQAIFVCAALEIAVAFNCVANYTKKSNHILFDTTKTPTEKRQIIFSILSKYHLTEGNENDFSLDSATINRMKSLTVSSLKQYKFILQLVEKLSTFKNQKIIFGSENTGAEYLKELCAARAVKETYGIIDAPIDRNEKKLITFRKYCDIPEAEEVYMLGDSSLFGSGKKGFALTTSGFYHNLNKSTEYWDWKLFSEKKIEVGDDTDLLIGELKFCAANEKLLFPMFSVLISLQKDVKGEGHPQLS